MAAFNVKPPHPDTLRAISTFWQALRLSLTGTLQRVKRFWQACERATRRVGGTLLDKKPRLLLALLTLVWLLPGTAQLPLVDRDEPRFAYATQEMLDRSDAWVPTFNGEWRFDKPPLVYWWMTLHYRVFGYNDLSARLHSVEATLICVLLIFGFASRLYGRAAGWMSALVFLTSLQVFLHGRLCVADMPMMMFIILVQWAAWELLQKSSWRWALVFWLGLALGFTTKWLVPWAVLFVGMVGYFALQKKWPWKFVGNFKPLTGLAVMLAVILAWAVPAWIETQGNFFRVGIGEHFFERGAMAFNARKYNPFFYLFSAFLSWMPWLMFAGGIVTFLRKDFDARAKYLLGWTAGVYVLFSLAQTQLPHYILPAFPSLAILLAAATQLKKPSGRWAGRFFDGVGVFWLSLLALAFVVVEFLPASGELAQLKSAALWLLLSLAALVLMARAVARRKILVATLCFGLTAALFGTSASLINGLTPAEKIARRLHLGHLPPVLVASGFEEPSLTAYAQARWVLRGDYFEARKIYDEAPEAALVVLGDEFTLESVPSVLLKSVVRPRRDNQLNLLRYPPAGGQRIHFEGLHLGRFSWVRGELYLKP